MGSIAKGWYVTFVGLAGDNPLEISRVTELGVREAFNFLAYKKDALRAAENESKEMAQKYNKVR